MAKKRGRPRGSKKPDKAYWDLHLALFAFRRGVPRASKKAAAARFLRENKQLIERLGLKIGSSRSESPDAAFRRLLNATAEGRKRIWTKRLAHLRQSKQWQEFERLAKRAEEGKVRPVILFIDPKSFGE